MTCPAKFIVIAPFSALWALVTGDRRPFMRGVFTGAIAITTLITYHHAQHEGMRGMALSELSSVLEYYRSQDGTDWEDDLRDGLAKTALSDYEDSPQSDQGSGLPVISETVPPSEDADEAKGEQDPPPYPKRKPDIDGYTREERTAMNNLIERMK